MGHSELPTNQNKSCAPNRSVGGNESHLNGDLLKDVPQGTGQVPGTTGEWIQRTFSPISLSLSVSPLIPHLEAHSYPPLSCFLGEGSAGTGGGNMATRARDRGPGLFSMRSSLLFWDLTLALAGAWDFSIASGFITEGGGGGRVRPPNRYKPCCSRISELYTANTYGAFR